MQTDTKERILKFISLNNGATAKNIINHLGYNPTGVFRHLKTLQEEKLIYKLRRPPRVSYFLTKYMRHQNKKVAKIFKWAINGDVNLINKSILCPTRDVLQARIDRISKILQHIDINIDLSYLITVSVGEIGNNSFDHNLGAWLDAPGVSLLVDTNDNQITLADRGQGVYKTIKVVKPDIINDKEALKIAFTKILSGRYPEQRGNCLKLVRDIIKNNNLLLTFYSGKAMCTITNQGIKITDSETLIPGTLATIKF